MKITWEPSDIVAGRKVGYADSSNSERYLIGYTYSDDGRHKLYALISLSDGMIVYITNLEKGDAQKQMSHYLNSLTLQPVEILK